ncbi:hypothetical protein AHF37_02429 [Paragonimus kellicotti]|nr:hypothetical protein AHF37_02429 [Paragonimus kellicotti]
MAGHHDQKKNLGTAATAVCGGVGGCLLWTAIFPFDVIKSRMQIGHIEAAAVSDAPPTAHPAPTSSTPPVTSAGSSSTLGSTNSPNMFKLLVRVARHEGIGALYRGLGPTSTNISSKCGPWAVTKTIFREQGLFGFTRGLSATFAREMPGYFFFFGGYEACRSIMAGHHDQKKNLGTAATAVCGGVGGCLLWTAIFPFDVIKSRMQIGHIEAAAVSDAPPTAHPAPTSSTPPVTSAGSSSTLGSTNSPNMFKLLVRVARHEGIGALYRGLGPTLLRTFPASGALFVAVEWTRKVGHWLLD